ncbi:MAG: autoinducer binding domain-containing protein [Pseudomonadota bacterium]
MLDVNLHNPRGLLPDSLADRLAELSPSGYLLVIRMGFFFPVYEQNTMPEKWADRYVSRGYMVSDPALAWCYANTGAIRWSEIDVDDPREVLAQAALCGLKHGAAVSCLGSGEPAQRSFGSFARSDREFNGDELSELSALLVSLHDHFTPPTNLTPAELEALRMVKNGLLMKEIANFLGVTEAAVKQRLKGAKLKLGAKNGTHAATMATSFGLI